MGQVRTARPEDGDAIAAIYRPYVEGTSISFEDVPPTAMEMADRIVTTLTTWPFLVFEENDRVLEVIASLSLAEVAA